MSRFDYEPNNDNGLFMFIAITILTVSLIMAIIILAIKYT